MKLGLTHKDLSEALSIPVDPFDDRIDSVFIDTRKIHDGNAVLFVALSGEFREGFEFVKNAYEKGVRYFLVEQIPAENYPDARFIVVTNCLKALQQIATHHRNKFNTKVIAITGSAGKTIVKEWLGQLLNSRFQVVRSPKSYNSQIGVALSLLEIRKDADFAIIEAGISKPGEMEILERMIRPEFGILTSIGSAHRENFKDEEGQLSEKLILFANTKKIIVHKSVPLSTGDRFKLVGESDFDFIHLLPFHDPVSLANASLVIAMALEIGMDIEDIKRELPQFQQLALRMETFEGFADSLIINDSYSLDIDAFRSSLEYQLSLSGDRKRIVLVGTDDHNKRDKIKALVAEFEPVELHFVEVSDPIIKGFENSVVLIKGSRNFRMERYAAKYRLKKHTTFVEINLNAIRDNIMYIKHFLPDSTKILAMVKASSYGSGGEKIALYLERIGVDHLGVAYADEGVQLRKAGVTCPILVMNAEESGFADCVAFKLEPSIYSLEQLEAFIKTLIDSGENAFPIHLKVETGMNRLGIIKSDIPSLISLIQAQPEVHIKSVYSHLATADDPKSDFVHEQATLFTEICSLISDAIPYTFDRHLLNSEGALNFPEYHFDMVRLGIAMYGHSSNEKHKTKLRDALTWYSRISQIKHVSKGQTIGYGQTMTADRDLRIAVIPVGYADGFRRSLSNGKAGVYINNVYCPVAGRVCMDMIMVELGDAEAHPGTIVEIIGPNQSLSDLAIKMETIPYEVMTGISPRVQRLYLED